VTNLFPRLAAALALLSPCAFSQSIVSWGYDTFGEVTGAPTSHEFTQIAAGGRHTVALKQDGTLTSWGYDGFGQVSGTPTDDGYVQVAAGEDHSLALKADGSIVSWGADIYGAVTNTPTGTGFVQLAAGPSYSLALKADGSITGWGTDWNLMLTNIPTGHDFVQVAAGGTWHSLALKADGSIVSWGTENSGLLSETPAGTGFIQVEGGSDQSVALRADGSIVTWGFAPASPPTGGGFVQVDAGFTGSVALNSDGSIVAWGDDYYGQLSTAPTANGYTQIAHGSAHLVALGGPLPGVAYCTAGTSALGCTPVVTASGTASASAGHGLTLVVPSVPGNNQNGLFFFGTNGRQAVSWGNGTSYQCVVPPVQRTPLVAAGGGPINACQGWYAMDLNAYWASEPKHNPGSGAIVQAQLWYRDPQNTSNQTTSLSSAIEIAVGP